MHSGLLQCGLVRNEWYANALHECKMSDHNFFLHTDRLPPMRLLPLDEWPEVIDHLVKSPPPHPQYVIEYVEGVYFEQVFIKPTCQPEFDVPLCILIFYMPRNKVENLLHMWVWQCVIFELSPLQGSACRENNLSIRLSFQFSLACTLCFSSFYHCNMHLHYSH